ncbi:MAG: hypothetical protein NZM40_08305 [Sphingomonadaceae bacterium]|uniref:hypothetical protein n=1 Tax=Thermaurantiacus sp. TaxID=2820283 RepID=UPI00298EF976|nr:hypothetical protein [Thermaurantiacus sp.]MCS6987411.1 hypothetical protein [Sphingomonadaceae bacterium]MDW8415331.1 hypothetical protein [Thermaurantiacus sp.]
MVAIAAPAFGGGPADRARLDAERAAALETRGPPVRCLMVGEARESRLLSPQLVLVRRGANQWFRSRLQSACPWASPARFIAYRTTTGLVCQGDSFDVVDPASRIRFGPCVLGEFEPVDAPEGRSARR